MSTVLLLTFRDGYVFVDRDNLFQKIFHSEPFFGSIDRCMITMYIEVNNVFTSSDLALVVYRYWWTGGGISR